MLFIINLMLLTINQMRFNMILVLFKQYKITFVNFNIASDNYQ
jgi:hypothetical protein